MRFVELDHQIEQRAGMRLPEIFTIHGEDFYRRLERETLADLLSARQSMVLAVGGGLVTAPDTYALLLRQTTTVWLKAKADDCWTRVARQGDRRPIDQHPQAREALRQLVARREPLYARAAHHGRHVSPDGPRRPSTAPRKPSGVESPRSTPTTCGSIPISPAPRRVAVCLHA